MVERVPVANLADCGSTARETTRRQGEANGARRCRGFTVVYGWAHFGKSLFWYVSEILFAFYLTEVGGLSGRDMGLVLALGLLMSVIVDLVLAWAFQRTLAEIGRAGTLQLFGAGLSALSLGALFVTPWIGVSPHAKFSFALGAMFAFRFAYALYDLPQNVLLALATTDTRGRTRAATVRLFFSGLATLIVSALAVVLLAEPQEDRAERFLGASAAISVLALWTAWGLHKALRAEGARWKPSSLPAPPHPRTRAAAMGLLLGATFIVSLTASLFTKLEPYLAAYVLQSPLWGGLMITMTALGATLSQPAWARLSERWSRPIVFGVAAGVLIVAALTFLIMVKAFAWGGAAASFLFGVASGGMGAIMWAAWGDAVAERAPRAGGLAFALFTGASKIGLALSGLVLGVFLHHVDYRGEDSDVILTFMTMWPALGAAACIAAAGIWWSLWAPGSSICRKR